MPRIVPADSVAIQEAAVVLRQGSLVAFPTETVYGLGACALNAASVRAIFEAKGRPATNPLIVHVLDLDDAARLVTEIPPHAAALARAFWPGPLTLVLPKRKEVPDEVTAGGSTVALRSPAHPIARALLKALGEPIAAPSANRSLEVSPTTAAHVAASLGDRISLILDGGPCQFGIESTVLDITGSTPVLLRPGSVSRAAIASVIGVEPISPQSHDGPLRSPGLLARHYAPHARVELVLQEQIGEARERLLQEGLQVGVLTTGTNPWDGAALPENPDGYAHNLYSALRDLDLRFNALIISLPGDGPAWEAVLNRLMRAASKE